MQIVDKPPSSCMTIHPLKKLHDFVVTQMVGEKRAYNEIRAARRIE